MNFRKSSKRPLPPPLIFGKLHCKFFKLATKPRLKKPCLKVQILQYKFLDWKCREIKKSNGSHCGIPGKFLSLISTPISFPLSRLFNNLFEAGHFPEIFKQSHITALYKGSGLKSDKENYRGIHLLPTLSKVAESIMHKSLLRHYISNNVISDRQAAYLKGDSTTQQLLYIVNMIKTNWNQGNFTQGCFLDASAAFDRMVCRQNCSKSRLKASALIFLSHIWQIAKFAQL